MSGARVLLAAALALATPAVAQGEVTKAVSRNVELFEELEVCASHPSFDEYGVARTGPCGEWLSEVEKARDDDRALLLSGFLCLAGDIRVAGGSFVSGDADHIAFVRDSVETCRDQLRVGE